MPKFTFTGLSVTSDTTSSEFQPECDQDMRWLLHLETSGLDGTPNVYIEEEVDGTWTPRQNPETLEFFFPVTDDLIGWRDAYFMGKKMRIRIVASGNTTGTVDGCNIHYKTKV